jgi:hypothetical protein
MAPTPDDKTVRLEKGLVAFMLATPMRYSNRKHGCWVMPGQREQ